MKDPPNECTDVLPRPPSESRKDVPWKVSQRADRKSYHRPKTVSTNRFSDSVLDVKEENNGSGLQCIIEVFSRIWSELSGPPFTCFLIDSPPLLITSGRTSHRENPWLYMTVKSLERNLRHNPSLPWEPSWIVSDLTPDLQNLLVFWSMSEQTSVSYLLNWRFPTDPRSNLDECPIKIRTLGNGVLIYLVVT